MNASHLRWGLFVIALGALLAPGAARADDERERELAERVRRLEAERNVLRRELTREQDASLEQARRYDAEKKRLTDEVARLQAEKNRVR